MRSETPIATVCDECGEVIPHRVEFVPGTRNRNGRLFLRLAAHSCGVQGVVTDDLTNEARKRASEVPHA